MPTSVGMGPRDADLIIRSSGNLTSTETISKTNFPRRGGNPKENALGLYVRVPSVSGTSPTLKVTYKVTTTNKKLEVTHTVNITAAGLYHLPIPQHDGDSVDVVLSVGGTSPNFGVTEVWMAQNDDVPKVPAG